MMMMMIIPSVAIYALLSLTCLCKTSRFLGPLDNGLYFTRAREKASIVTSATGSIGRGEQRPDYTGGSS